MLTDVLSRKVFTEFQPSADELDKKLMLETTSRFVRQVVNISNELVPKLAPVVNVVLDTFQMSNIEKSFVESVVNSFASGGCQNQGFSK
jgi:hypothetical protein